MRKLKNSVFVITAIFLLAGCSGSLDIDSMALEGQWYLKNADEGVTEDGSIQYAFLADGTSLVTVCNFLDPSADATHYSQHRWSLVGNRLSIDTEGGFNYLLSRKSKDKILCTSDSHSTEYYLLREKGTDYSAVIGMWSGTTPVTMTNNDGVQSEHTMTWLLEFMEGQKCRMTTGIVGMYGMNVVNYLCFWYPEGAVFRLVDSDMKCKYEGSLMNGKISLHQYKDTESIALEKVRDK